MPEAALPETYVRKVSKVDGRYTAYADIEAY